jgi:hypothetical protein
VLRYSDQGGYVPVDSVNAGEGYYVQYQHDTTIWQSGLPANLPLRVPVVDGWNIVGGASMPVRSDRVTASGTTIISDFVTTIGGAQVATVLQPGRGYWVHVSGSGVITLNPDP